MKVYTTRRADHESRGWSSPWCGSRAAIQSPSDSCSVRVLGSVGHLWDNRGMTPKGPLGCVSAGQRPFPTCPRGDLNPHAR